MADAHHTLRGGPPSRRQQAGRLHGADCTQAVHRHTSTWQPAHTPRPQAAPRRRTAPRVRDRAAHMPSQRLSEKELADAERIARRMLDYGDGPSAAPGPKRSKEPRTGDRQPSPRVTVQLAVAASRTVVLARLLLFLSRSRVLWRSGPRPSRPTGPSRRTLPSPPHTPARPAKPHQRSRVFRTRIEMRVAVG
jgi:hypothetical protein